MKDKLKGKIAIVTGAGQGIGRATALLLAQKGATVVVAEFNTETANSVAGEIKELGRSSLAYPIDIGDPPAVRNMIEEVVGQFGQLDILVNNAGISKIVPFLELTEDNWDEMMKINLRGTFFCLQAGAVQMVRQLPGEIKNAGKADRCYGKIVNMTSISGQAGRPLAPHYAASKAALINITQSAALTLAPYGINVNAVAPGLVLTPMWDRLDLEYGKISGAGPGESMSAFIDNIPLKRPANPDDVAEAIRFLCSPESDNITGHTLNVDGGFEMH
jgi:NAD(P)-dependent dehydrogenase (short-subunit alcohol dehydrogenase family)